MQLSQLKQSIQLTEEYTLIKAVERLLTESKPYQRLLKEAFSKLFLARYPEFDPKTVTRILARLSIAQQKDPRNKHQINDILAATIQQELAAKGVKDNRIAQLMSDEMVIKNFLKGMTERPEWASIEKPVRQMTGREEPAPTQPLHKKVIGAKIHNPFAF